MIFCDTFGREAMSAEMKLHIEAVLKAHFTPETLSVVDESHLHAGHAGVREHGGGHYRVEIVAEAFAAMNAVARHRAIYALFRDAMRGPIHALAIDARAPGEAPAVSAPRSHTR